MTVSIEQRNQPRRRKRAGFTLLELMLAIGILALLAAFLLPVLHQAREKGRQASCISGLRQLSTALLLYLQDYDEHFPNGLYSHQGRRVWPGQGWAGQCNDYISTLELLTCPSDFELGPRGYYSVSYGINKNLMGDATFDEPARPGLALSTLTSGAQTVLLFEVAGVYVNLRAPMEGARPTQETDPDPTTSGNNTTSGPVPTEVFHFSASGNGLDNRLYAQPDWATSPENQYATGYLGGRTPADFTVTQFASREGRHQGGANYLLCDGHVRWLKGARVSSGQSASAPPCNQDNQPALANCTGRFRAAGTENTAFAATFSTL